MVIGLVIGWLFALQPGAVEVSPDDEGSPPGSSLIGDIHPRAGAPTARESSSRRRDSNSLFREPMTLIGDSSLVDGDKYRRNTNVFPVSIVFRVRFEPLRGDFRLNCSCHRRRSSYVAAFGRSVGGAWVVEWVGGCCSLLGIYFTLFEKYFHTHQHRWCPGGYTCASRSLHLPCARSGSCYASCGLRPTSSTRSGWSRRVVGQTVGPTKLNIFQQNSTTERGPRTRARR